MRILVTGSSGLLGLNLCLLMQPAHEMTGVDRNQLGAVPFQVVKADLLEAGAIERILEATRPEAVIHCAALANLEACDQNPQEAERLNADLPGKLAAACARSGTKLVHISTDSVFDGTKDGIYSETDIPNPAGVYSATKLRSEQVVLGAHPQAIVVRVNFFGWSLGGKHSLSEYFYRHLAAGEPCNGFTDVCFCPLFVGDLAETLVKMLEKGLSGLYHVVGSEALTKYEFGLRIARRFGFDERLIRPISVEDAGLTSRRSHNLRLSVHKLSTDLGQDIPGVSTGIEKFYTQFRQGYPQKLRSYQQG